jgi:diguanylate cyclase (GGDEF)-like protein
MIEARPFPQEQQRLASLRALHLLDTPIEERFERITRMVCRLLDVPIALFNLIDEDRQHYKSVQGLPNTDAALKAAFCTHTIQEEEMLLVPNALENERFFDNPFVTGEYLNIGFYAGCPVRTPNGMPIGSLCAIDTRPRQMTPEQIAILRDLAAMLETELKVVSLSKAQESLVKELDAANHMALVDPLTRLWNRSGIHKLLEREWSESARQGKPVTLVMTDIDHFKKINDTFGHPAGDAVLKTIAKKLLESLRGEDAVGRVGGEEFLIILTDCEPSRVFDTVERIRRTVQDHNWIIEGKPHPVTMSFGAATAIPGDGLSAETLIKRADEALYRATNTGRNKVEIEN